MLRLKCQCEMAMIIHKGKVVWSEGAPEGYFFVDHSRFFREDATEDEVYSYLASVMIPCDQLFELT